MNVNQRRFYYYRLLSFVMYASPLVILFIINKDEYITYPERSISFWAYVIAIFVALALKDKLTASAKHNTIMTVSVVIFVVSLLMRYIANQMLLISTMSLIGCVCSNIFERVADAYKAKVWVVHDGIVCKIRGNKLTHKHAWVIAYIGE